MTLLQEIKFVTTMSLCMPNIMVVHYLVYEMLWLEKAVQVKVTT